MEGRGGGEPEEEMRRRVDVGVRVADEVRIHQGEKIERHIGMKMSRAMLTSVSVFFS